MITIKDIQELKEIEHFQPLEKAIHTICILDKKDIDSVEQMKVKDLFKRFNELTDGLKFDDTIKLKFKFKGRRFRMIKNATEMQGQHFIQLQQYKDVVENLHEIMALLTEQVNIFGKAIKVKNLGEHFQEKSNMFRQLPYQYAHGYSLFFSLLYPKLLDATQIYLSQMVKKLQHQATQLKDGST
jgi:hypothetical protein